MDEARERFGGLVATHQRRAARIAYQYLRDAADADEAVQDAFVKAFSHITSYREAWPFEVWFTRILINGCLDRRKARGRRERWFVPGEISSADEARVSVAGAARCQPRSAAAGARAPRPASPPRSIGSTAGSGRCSCCVITAIARRAKSAPSPGSTNRPFASICFEPRANCAACWEASREHPRRLMFRKSGCSSATWPSVRSEPLDPRVAEHLADCDGCAVRYTEFTSLHGRTPHRSGRGNRRPVHRRAAAGAAARDRASSRSRRTRGPRHQLSR